MDQNRQALFTFILSRLLKLMKIAWQCRNINMCKRRCDMHRATLIECDIYCDDSGEEYSKFGEIQARL